MFRITLKVRIDETGQTQTLVGVTGCTRGPRQVILVTDQKVVTCEGCNLGDTFSNFIVTDLPKEILDEVDRQDIRRRSRYAMRDTTLFSASWWVDANGDRTDWCGGNTPFDGISGRNTAWCTML